VLSLLPLPAQLQKKQETAQKPDDVEVIKVNSNLVNLDVTVKDKKGKAITDLKAEDFTLSETASARTSSFLTPPSPAVTTRPDRLFP
jgi:hypothetical protein